ncbi:MAG TPA: ABC transporter permease, partial [Candidatus Polarisedimenticolia bacterium]|nr:ABC transporter permease [Candidatus Polarisedimenticolia bacterium]
MKPSRSLRSGLLLALACLALSLLAPVLANEAPLLVREAEGICSPALGAFRLTSSLRCSSPPPQSWTRARKSNGSAFLLDALVPYGPEQTDLDAVLLPPGSPHVLGTDSLGRDVLSRVLHGFPVALLVGGLATGLSLVVGVSVGACAGLGGRWLDLGLSRIIDLMACFPTLILALALAAAAARPGVGSLVIAIGMTRWTGIARFFRGEILRQRSRLYCEAARSAGAGIGRLLFQHLIPNALAPILVTAAFSASHAILLEAGMSFLGVGV